MRTQVKAFKCAGCNFLTVERMALPFVAKVWAGYNEKGSTLRAHTDDCLVRAVQELMVAGPLPEEPGLDTPLPGDELPVTDNAPPTYAA